MRIKNFTSFFFVLFTSLLLFTSAFASSNYSDYRAVATIHNDDAYGYGYDGNLGVHIKGDMHASWSGKHYNPSPAEKEDKTLFPGKNITANDLSSYDNFKFEIIVSLGGSNWMDFCYYNMYLNPFDGTPHLVKKPHGNVRCDGRWDYGGYGERNNIQIYYTLLIKKKN